ncbi:HNH endonuclease [Serinicoccus chungangensis]|uniref:HNH endonuclease n=1 Tax=Serinicoccus chungangensis TaxID=767452 RepID=UPI001117BB8E|nr:HNH endonuclease signature motif containing protein [Serinicoccus chungangensis]
MASWVITIAKEYRQHWDYARRDGLWDMPKNFRIREGDLVYFRVSGGPLIGQGMATSDARPLTSRDTVPWDDGRDPYTTRFRFELMSDAPLETPKWGAVGSRLTKNPPLQGPRSWSNPHDEAVLASYFSSSVAERVMEQLLDDNATPGVVAGLDLHVLSDDQRDLVKQLIAIRQGQTAFRNALLEVYAGCAVTGTRFAPALDAAHIYPYKGVQSNEVRNGLILRKDIHRLFDLDLLALEDDGTIRVAPEVSEPIYKELDGTAARFPEDRQSRPDPAVLQAHRRKCSWLPEPPTTPTVDDDPVLF